MGVVIAVGTASWMIAFPLFGVSLMYAGFLTVVVAGLRHARFRHPARLD